MSSYPVHPPDPALLALLEQADMVPASILRSLLDKADGDGDLFERLLVSEGSMTDEQCGRIKAEAHRWKFVDLEKTPVSQGTLQLLPASFMRARLALPFAEDKDAVCIALPDPGDVSLVRMLEKKFPRRLAVYAATPSALRSALARSDEGFQETCRALLASQGALPKGSEDRTIINLLSAMIRHGIQQRASDIHVEPQPKGSVIRQRIDGILHPMLAYPKDLHPFLVTRIKVLAGLATDEHAAPQDGKFIWTENDVATDIRVSIVPITHGEKVVMRILAAQGQALTLESLGLSKKARTLLEAQMQRSWGMILVTGPTGSGKTTTLYGVVRPLNRPEVNIATIEDPVEYDLAGVNQIQVHEKSGITFAGGLRSIVRQDPNIILVGEVRDSETAGIAVNAAMTGHLVLSTMHTNNAATSIPRLIDMGIEPFLIASTINMIVGQRLVRTICPRCRESMGSLSEHRKSFPEDVLKRLLPHYKNRQLYHGRGCELCHGTGFRGRTGIFEVMPIDDDVRVLIMSTANADMIERTAVRAGMTTMLEDGVEKAFQGITTLDEVLRVIRT